MLMHCSGPTRGQMLTEQTLPQLQDYQVYMAACKHPLLDIVDWLSENVSSRRDQADEYYDASDVIHGNNWWIDSLDFGWVIEINDHEKFVEFKLRFS